MSGSASAGIAPPNPGLTTYRQAAGRPQNRRPDVVAPPPLWTLDEPAAATATTAAHACAAPVASHAEEVVEVPFARPAAKQLSKARAIEDVRADEGDEAARQMQNHLGEIDDLADPSGGGLIFSEEICIGTDGFHVEGVVSNCAICEDTELKMKELECKKAEQEVETLKCEIELCKLQLDPKDDEDPPKDDDKEKQRKYPKQER